MNKTSKRIVGIAVVVLLIAVALVGAGSAEGHTHNDVTFEEWTSTTSLPDTGGSYFLGNDVTLTSTWTVPSGTTNLCLNGHVIKMTGFFAVIGINKDVTLNLYDCGTTEHTFRENENGLWVLNGAGTGTEHTVIGGCITGGTGITWGGGGVYNSGTFNFSS